MRFALTITAAAAAGLLAGCMGGDDSAKFDAAAYRAGDCRSAAAPVFEINQAVRPVVADKRDPGEAAETLKRSQRTLIEAMP
ncbi:MAG TPA: hypothetical protein VNA12_08875, partial [Mycobacteriales bacterium]|nr:hypothetical protein [Mycobacteriales bacterium]